ncbi:Gfo/Idh/MocA family protein [Actinomadura nitritigenes]|uniref:Gfo/Idh/MocA family protein n=1 Tax=Actinomadura nitritigenes TaxID=134602 RepID=UPI003D9080CD
MSAVIELALIGCGGMARRHIAGLAVLQQTLQGLGRAPAISLSAVADPDRGRAESVADEAQALLGTRPVVHRDLDEALRADRYEAIDINTSSQSHEELGLAALEAGRHLFMEKPLATTIAGATALVNSAARRARVLAVAENVRREPVNRLARHLLEQGVLGEPRFISDETYTGADLIQLTPWRHRLSSGGLLLDVGVHNADTIEYLFGPLAAVAGMLRLDEPVRRRPARSHVRSAAFYETFAADLPEAAPADAHDVLTALLDFQGTAAGQWTNHQAAHGAAVARRTLYGSLGSLSLPADRSGDEATLSLDDGRVLTGAEILQTVPAWRLDDLEAAIWGAPAPTSSDRDFAVTDRNLLAIEFGDFTAAIADGRRPEVDAAGGRRAMAVTLAVAEAATARRWVTIDEVEDGTVHRYQDTIVAEEE